MLLLQLSPITHFNYCYYYNHIIVTVSYIQLISFPNPCYYCNYTLHKMSQYRTLIIILMIATRSYHTCHSIVHCLIIVIVVLNLVVKWCRFDTVLVIIILLWIGVELSLCFLNPIPIPQETFLSGSDPVLLLSHLNRKIQGSQKIGARAVGGSRQYGWRSGLWNK